MTASELTSCPNCRGGATLIAIWNFIGPRPDPTQGQPNLLQQGLGYNNGVPDPNIITSITTPRSMVTDYDFGTPQSSSNAFPVFPSTDLDAEHWSGSLGTSSSSSSRPNYGTGASSSHHAYISNTELADGRQALLIDPGSFNNLTGSPWARRTAQLANRHGRASRQFKRQRDLNVSGVGTDAQVCTHDCELPIEFRTTDGRHIAGTFRAPTINGHPLPALLGLRTLIDRRAILDLTRMVLSFTGPGDTVIEYSPGTDSFQLLQAPSGHLMLPCCDYSAATAAAARNLALHVSTSSVSPYNQLSSLLSTSSESDTERVEASASAAAVAEEPAAAADPWAGVPDATAEMLRRAPPTDPRVLIPMPWTQNYPTLEPEVPMPEVGNRVTVRESTGWSSGSSVEDGPNPPPLPSHWTPDPQPAVGSGSAAAADTSEAEVAEEVYCEHQ